MVCHDQARSRDEISACRRHFSDRDQFDFGPHKTRP